MSGYKVSAELIGGRQLAAALNKAPEVVTRELRRLVASGAQTISNRAKANAPVNYGQLRASIHTEGPTGSGSRVQAKVGTDVTYAAYQEYGTGIYGPRHTPITPKSKPYLVFKTKDGRWIRTRSVKGVQGRFYFKRSITSSMPEWRRRQQEALARIADGIR